MSEQKPTEAVPAADAEPAKQPASTDQDQLNDQDLDGVSGGRNVPDGGGGYGG